MRMDPVSVEIGHEEREIVADTPQNVQTTVSSTVFPGKVEGKTVAKIQQVNEDTELVTEPLAGMDTTANRVERQEDCHFQTTAVEMEENMGLGMEVETIEASRGICHEEKMVVEERAMSKHTQESYVSRSRGAT